MSVIKFSIIEYLGISATVHTDTFFLSQRGITADSIFEKISPENIFFLPLLGEIGIKIPKVTLLVGI